MELQDRLRTAIEQLSVQVELSEASRPTTTGTDTGVRIAELTAQKRHDTEHARVVELLNKRKEQWKTLTGEAWVDDVPPTA